MVVATDDLAIASAVEMAGGEAVMTRADHVNGTSRIHEALHILGSDEEIVVNLQGDLPTVVAGDRPGGAGAAGADRRSTSPPSAP